MTEPRFPAPQLREDFRRELRAKLLLEAQTVLVAPRRDAAWRTWMRPALGVGLAGVVLMAGAGTAAAGSVPGDAAFALKRAVEDIHVSLTFDDVSRVQLLAEIADRRLAELQSVADRVDRAPVASEEYAKAVTAFRAAVDALRQAAPADKADRAQDVADAARDKHEAILDMLEDRLPENALPAIERAKDEESKDDDRGPKDGVEPDKARTPRPTRTARPTATPRAVESPRGAATLRPSVTPRLPTPRPSGDQKDGD